jgi:hypothetical protein
MARISEAEAGALSNTKASRTVGDHRRNAGIVLAEVLVGIKLVPVAPRSRLPATGLPPAEWRVR